MRKRLFLTGPDRCGKSEMIQLALGEKLRHAGGFVTLRERDAEGNILGFDLMAADGSGQKARFLEMTEGKPMTHLEVFSHEGVRLLNQAANRPFAVLDELGGAELLDDGFVRALVQLVRGPVPCIGVVKSLDSVGKTVGVMGLNLRYELARRVLYDYMMKDPNTQVIQTTGLEDETAMAQIRQWVDEYVKI
jgi:nucleoside-triphosphatase